MKRAPARTPTAGRSSAESALEFRGLADQARAAASKAMKGGDPSKTSEFLNLAEDLDRKSRWFDCMGDYRFVRRRRSDGSLEAGGEVLFAVVRE